MAETKQEVSPDSEQNASKETESRRISADDNSEITAKEGTDDEDAYNLIDKTDWNYVQELAKMPVSNNAVLDPTDQIAMRKWLAEEYIKWPKHIPATARMREPVQIHVQTVPVTYGNDDGKFSVRVYQPLTPEDSSCRPALIMYHGGGWNHGSPEVDEELAEFFSSELRAVVINVDYRLAPEYPFPCALDDCYETIPWIFNHAAEYRIDTNRIGLWGCSAGGNLAAGVALRDAAEHHVSRLRHVNLVVPVTCHPDLYPEVLQAAGSSYRAPWLPALYPDALRAVWDGYARSQFSHPHASVLVADPPSNHAPVHVTVAGRDGLRDEGIAYALRLRDAGIDSQLEIIPGVPHGLTVPTTTHAARQFFKNQARVLNCALNLN